MLAGIIGAAIGALVVYFLACTVAGMSPSKIKLASYERETKGQARFFREPVASVVQAYGDAATKAAGMNVADVAPNQLLVDASPTMRILGGSFGMMVRYSFAETGTGTAVTIDGGKKVSWATSINPAHALTEIERTVRMKAKKGAGLTEVTANEVNPSDLPPTARGYEG